MSIIFLPDRSLLLSWSRPQQALQRLSLRDDQLTDHSRVGGGPGEVRFIYRMHRSWNDSIFALDLMLRRMNVFGPDGTYVRSFPFQFMVDEFVQLRNGGFMAFAELASREASGMPLHLFSTTGELLLSFGSSDRTMRVSNAEDRSRLRRKLTLLADGTVMTVTVDGYVLEHWQEDGTRLGEWNVAPEWFTNAPGARHGTMETPKLPGVRALQVDAQDRLWVLVGRMDEQWKRAVRPPIRPPATYSITSTDEYNDTQVEVFQLPSMRRLASTRVDPALEWFVDRGLAATYGSRRDDVPVLKLVRLHLVAP